MTDACPGVTLEFEARKGVFITGRVEPALEGVLVKITAGEDKKIELTTDASGSYRYEQF